MSAKEGLYATISLGHQNAVGLLTGVELSWTQETKRFYSMGSIIPQNVLKGVIAWEGRFRKAYNTSAPNMGSFALGTYLIIGTIFPRGGTNPLVSGTFCFTGGSLRNMSAESVNAVEEEESFILYNVTMTD